MPGGGQALHVAVASDGSLIVTARPVLGPGDESVSAFDAAGFLRGTRTLPNVADDTVATAGDLVYVPSAPVGDPPVGDAALLALSLADGTTRWTAPLPPFATAPLVAGGVVYTSAGQDLVALDAAGCGSAVCSPLLAVPGGGRPRSIGEGQLYTTSLAPDTLVTTLRAFRVG